ncbi:polysaccharide deacetylase family protein [Thermanaerosceptrum fracticalcis]|jgi:probable sporulation protein (polysaccharide deacetylase family)|uniref:Polysaccharide deacetylase family protein n=1 Tax=Thermanaerosceptrum fracticalcis TaxID=1712410 RepID=A0A7G6E0W1_THEFR|nr:polysaccharide deacetylase family protein [Thermanaerosceptrum fracticalcis]QNB45715.1 polysaccharide deacetylase family protein [Thermanaerosceptrum fracticalcis]
MYIIFLRKKHILLFIMLTVVIVLVFGSMIYFRDKDVPTVNPIYLGNTKDKTMAFTINVDWGEDVLPGMLAALRSKNIKASFFITGRFARKFPEIVQQIAKEGHEIGNHGYSHPHADKLSLEQNKKEIRDTEKVLQDLGITVSKIFAPPYGEHKPHVVAAAEALGYKTIMWTADTVDWQNPSAEVIKHRVLSKADNGVIVLMHPKKCTLDALPALIDALKDKGFTLKTVSEILQ